MKVEESFICQQNLEQPTFLPDSDTQKMSISAEETTLTDVPIFSNLKVRK